MRAFIRKLFPRLHEIQDLVGKVRTRRVSSNSSIY